MVGWIPLIGRGSLQTVAGVHFNPPVVFPAVADKALMFQLVYTSTASNLVTERDLQDILRVARATNSRMGITGVLLHHCKAFLQVLEGEEDAVEALFAAIESDLRHHDVIVLSRLLVGEREFDGWSMKFLDTGDWAIKPGMIGYNSLREFAQAEVTMKPYLRRFHAHLSVQGALLSGPPSSTPASVWL